MTCSLVENNNEQYLGKILSPFKCCDYQIDIVDKTNTLKYKIWGDCCQLGTFCQCPCEPCQTIKFDIKTPNGEIVSTMEKVCNFFQIFF